jgi:hypothetical protein
MKCVASVLKYYGWDFETWMVKLWFEVRNKFRVCVVTRLKIGKVGSASPVSTLLLLLYLHTLLLWIELPLLYFNRTSLTHFKYARFVALVAGNPARPRHSCAGIFPHSVRMNSRWGGRFRPFVRQHVSIAILLQRFRQICYWSCALSFVTLTKTYLQDLYIIRVLAKVTTHETQIEFKDYVRNNIFCI